MWLCLIIADILSAIVMFLNGVLDDTSNLVLYLSRQISDPHFLVVPRWSLTTEALTRCLSVPS